MSSGDRSKSRSQFHRSLPNTFAANLEDLQTYSKQCITAMNSMCQASGHLAETFAALFHDTSLAEAALRMQEVTHDLGSRTQDASTQVEEDVTGMMNRVINKGSSEKSEEAVQTLARCFLLMLQTQYHFFQTAADLHAPLSRYQELEDLFIGEECQPEVRDACSSWMSAAQLTRSLRRGDSLTSDEVNLLETERGKSSQDDPKLMEARRKLESQSMIYKHEIAILPQTSFALLGGFHLHLQCLSMLLRSCCMPSEAQDIINRHGSSQLAAMAMGIGNQTTVGQTEPQVNQQEWFEAVCRELKTTTLQVDGTLCRQTSNVEEDFNIKMKTIKNLVKELATHLGLMVDVQSITAQIVSHACSSLAYLHSQTAVQLLFGRAYVVTARAAEVAEPYKRYAQVTSQEGAIVIEVPSVWDLVMVGGAGLQGVCPDVQDNNNTGSSQQAERQKQQQQQSQSGLGACEVVYSAKIDLLDVVERRRISLPIIQVKLVKKDITITVTGPHTSMSSTSMTSTTQSDSLSSPCGMKRTIEKLVSKFRQRVPISKATPASSSPPSATTAHASRSAFYLPISQLEVQAAVVGGGVSPGNASHTACSSLLSSPSISSGSSTMSSNSSLYERETPDSDGPKNIKMMPGEKVIKSDPKDYDGKSPMLGPMVTITSEPSPVDEKNHWETSIMRQHDLTRTKKGLASDSVLADLVNLLSGVRARSSSHLEPGTQGNRPFHDSVTRTSSSSSTSSQGGSGWGGRSDANDNGNRFGNYNPSFQEGDLIDRIQDQHSSMWPVKAFPHQVPPHQAQQDQVPLRRMSFDNNNEADFANYVAMNQLGKRSKRYGDNLNVAQQQHPGHSPQLSPRPIVKTQQQWSVGSVKEEGPMSKTWPSSDMGPERNENLNNTWSNPAHDSGSSSDEASNSGENPNTLLSMVHSSPAGSGLLTPVSRRHSSGEDTLHGKPFCPSPEPIMHYLDVIPTDKTGTKTWPPKMVWQRPNSPQPPPLGTGAPPGGGATGSLGSSTNQLWHHQSPSREHLNVHAPLTPQWSDPLSLRAPSVWAPSSTPVSPSGSMNTIATSSTATSHSQGASPNLSIRGHPKLDRRYAYTYH
nr:granule associated Rac and RHOG effector protein 1-like isoform X2 [Lytechinus pictus]